MRPDEPPVRGGGVAEAGVGAILDADLLRIDADLRAAGRQAERALRGRTQPTRWFAIGLRSRVVRGWGEPAPEGEGAFATPR